MGMVDEGERQTNARLIASAPDLLALIQQLPAFLMQVRSDDDAVEAQRAELINQSRAAIARATPPADQKGNLI